VRAAAGEATASTAAAIHGVAGVLITNLCTARGTAG
jgi:hypothetical protein